MVRQRKRNMADWRVVRMVVSPVFRVWLSLPHVTHQINHQILVILALHEREDTAVMRFSTGKAMRLESR
jgi:hypothetical protein